MNFLQRYTPSLFFNINLTKPDSISIAHLDDVVDFLDDIEGPLPRLLSFRVHHASYLLWKAIFSPYMVKLYMHPPLYTKFNSLKYVAWLWLMISQIDPVLAMCRD